MFNVINTKGGEFAHNLPLTKREGLKAADTARWVWVFLVPLLSEIYVCMIFKITNTRVSFGFVSCMYQPKIPVNIFRHTFSAAKS